MNDAPRAAILVVEDDPHVLRGLCDLIRSRSFDAVGVTRGEDALERARDASLVLLDVMLPGIDGFEVCARLREAHPRLPIVLLTARGAEADVLRGFSLGADDYVTKPFAIAEVLARIEAVLRRAEPLAQVRAPFVVGEWTLDPERMTATAGALVVALTRRELELLAFFRREAGRIVSRRLLLAEVWRMPGAERVDTRTVDVHISKLRKKLGPRAHALIETVHGEGYRLPEAP
jgi:two-component system response regulator RegX3